MSTSFEVAKNIVTMLLCSRASGDYFISHALKILNQENRPVFRRSNEKVRFTSIFSVTSSCIVLKVEAYAKKYY